jgi:hypothetical protein
MTSMSLRMTTDIELQRHRRQELRGSLLSFLERETNLFRDLHLQFRLKRLKGRAQKKLIQCTLNLFTERGRFHAAEESFELDAAVRNALSTLRHQIERNIAQRRDSWEKSEGRRALEV